MAQCVKRAARQIVAMLRPDNSFQSFGLILLVLASIGLISFTSKFIFGLGRIKIINMSESIYDPDHGRNITRICPFATNTYQIQYNRTMCFNKTMHYWYIPWMRYAVWRRFDEINCEKRMKRLRESERAKGLNNEEHNETKLENVAEDVTVPTDTPSNRKMKDEPSKVVCTILAALLVISSVVAFCEVFRDKYMTKTKTSPRASKQSFSHANPSLNEILKQAPDIQRQEPFQSTAKVTQTLVHQTSLDRAFSRLSSEGVKPLFRRSSVPTQMMSIGGLNDMTTFFHGYPHGYGQQMNPSDSPEARRKSRHFIRRH